MKKTFLILVLSAVAVASWMAPCRAEQTSVPGTDDVRAVLELMRSDLNGMKVRAINEAMKLTGPEADKFWPIYRAYEKELSAVGDRKLSLIREFLEYHEKGNLDDKTAKRLAKAWLRNVRDRLDLWSKYNGKISRALSPIRGAQFLQVEHQMALFIDLNIASEMPTIGARP